MMLRASFKKGIRLMNNKS